MPFPRYIARVSYLPMTRRVLIDCAKVDVDRTHAHGIDVVGGIPAAECARVARIQVVGPQPTRVALEELSRSWRIGASAEVVQSALLLEFKLPSLEHPWISNLGPRRTGACAVLVEDVRYRAPDIRD